MNVADPNRAIYFDLNCGPVFGGSFVKEGEKFINGDIRVVDNGNLNTDNASFLGDAYKHPSWLFGSRETFFFLAGTQKFQIEEIEVFQRLK